MKRIFAAALLLITARAFAGDLAAPMLLRRVTDLTGTLNGEEVGRLESLLEGVERNTSNQIAVLMIPSLQGREIREFGVEIAQKNRLGQKGKDNGALLLIAKDDRKMAIEVGYGLEGVLPDAVCDQIIRHEIGPRFKQGDFFGGVLAGVTSMTNAAAGQYKIRQTGRSRASSQNGALLFLIPLVFFFAILSFRRSVQRVSSSGYRSPWFWGGLGGGGFGGGGGFSGGGGGFGGGGASGGW